MLNKNYKFIIVVTLLLFFTSYKSIALAAEEPQNDIDELYHDCLEFIKMIDDGDEDASGIEAGYCLGYFQSFRDQVGFFKILDPDFNICFPEDLALGQLVRVFINDVRDNPKDMNEHQSLGVLRSMHRSFPCQ